MITYYNQEARSDHSPLKGHQGRTTGWASHPRKPFQDLKFISGWSVGGCFSPVWILKCGHQVGAVAGVTGVLTEACPLQCRPKQHLWVLWNRFWENEGWTLVIRRWWWLLFQGLATLLRWEVTDGCQKKMPIIRSFPELTLGIPPQNAKNSPGPVIFIVDFQRVETHCFLPDRNLEEEMTINVKRPKGH